MRLMNTLKTIRQEINNALDEAYAKQSICLDKEEDCILSEIKKKGFFVIDSFYTASECEQNRIEIDNLIKKHKNRIFKDHEDSDHRIFGADCLSEVINKFYKHPFINRFVRAHEKTLNISGLTLAAKLEYKPGNLGSGAGWHRDWAVNKQIKAMLYLTDVEEKNGPFQYIESSHSHLAVIRESALNNFEFNQNRFTDEEVNRIIERNKSKLKTFAAKAGTLILVNTRGIHRGMPIKSGTRYALTNYYWSNMPIPEHIEKMIIRS